MQSDQLDFVNITASVYRQLKFDEDDPGAVRDPPISISDYVLDQAGSELGFFYFLMLGCVFMLLNQVDGKIFRLKIFLMNRDFHLVQNEGFVIFLNGILRMLSWISLLMPFMALGIWTAGLLVRARDFHQNPIGGVCVLMVGMSFFWFSFGVLKIKWNNYQFNGFNGLCFALAFLFLTAYHFVATFLNERPSYFGFSAIFLCANCMIMLLIVFLNMGIKGGSIRDLLNEKLEKGQPRDDNRETDFLEEINEEKANKQYFPTYQDVLDLFTIAKISEHDMASAFGGGLQHQFSIMGYAKRRTLTFILWCCAIAILIIYSYVIYWYLNNSYLGFITMVAVILTDIILYLIYNSKIVDTTTPLALTLLLNRLLLFVFGGDWWIYGYMVLFMFYAVILSIVIARKRFPFESAFDEMNLDNISDNKRSVDIIKVPEFLLGVITAIYSALFTVLYVIEPQGIPLKYLDIDNWQYPYYICGVFCLLLVTGFFCALAVYRLFYRKRKRIEPKVHFYVKNRKFDLYWVFVVLSFISNVVIGLIAYWITDSVSFFLVIALVTIFVLLYINAYLHYILNDYEILENIDALNAKIQKHNERLGLLKEKVVKFKKDLKEGNAGAVGAASLGLAQNIIKQDKLKKQQSREQKSIKVANEQQSQQLASQKTNMWVSMVGQPTILTNNKQYASNNSQNPSQSQAQKKPLQQTASNYNSSTVNIKVVPTPGATKVNANAASDEVDKLIEQEMQNNKSSAKDEIYEGGEEEDIRNQMNQDEKDLERHDNSDDDDSTDEELDPEGEDDQEEARQKKRMKEIVDWRDTMNWFQAFWKGRLRHNDYQIIFSLLIGHAAIAVCALLVCLDNSNYVGITITIPMVHYGMAIFSLIKVLSTDSKMTWIQYFFFFFAYCIQYGWGIANLYLSYTSEDIDPNLEGSADAGGYIVVYLIVIPFITSSLTAVLKWIDDKGKFSPFFLIQLFLTLSQGVGMLVLAYVYMTFIQGIIISCAIVAVGYIVLQVWIYVKNDYYMPKAWSIVNSLIGACLVVAPAIVSLCVEEFKVFFGFSISIWVLALLLFIYSFAEIFSDVAHIETKPLFFSPWVFPVYIYNPKKNDVESHNMPSIAMIFSYVILLIWSVLASVWIFPHHVGVALSILFELALCISVLFLVSVSQEQLKHVTADIDKKIIRRAWLDAKLAYVNGRNATNREQLVTYEKMIERRNFFRNYMRKKENRQYLSMEEKSEGVAFVEDQDIDIEWIDENMVNLNSQHSCYSYLYEIERELFRVYREELELIIQFQLLLVQNAENLQEQKKKYLFTFLNEKKAALFALGIVINIPDQGSMSIRYARVITQIQKLTPEKQTMFNHLRDHYILEQRDIDEKRRESARIEEEKEKERQEMLSQMSEEKKKLLASINLDTPVEKMPDCEMKYKKILMEADQGKLFEDSQFKPDNSSLGEKCLNRGVAKWMRARDKPNCVLYKDKINHLDVVQGALGDCYFLSAISVLGEKFVKRIILSTEEDWKKSGAFYVQFYKDGQPETIIIDDFFPAYGNNDWSFVKGGNEGDELWPMVLEKAYAKMYGSYNYIEAGKVQYALSDMTDGFPEQMDLKIEGKNMQVFWEKVKTLKRHGCLLGAGSPENALGDRAINEMGIVQGHAYSVLDVQEVDGTRLMQLRNPHGSSGEEWKGDWSDTCLKWTQRMRNKVGYVESGKDGVFWMDALDFVQQYSYLYICRILDDDQGWKEVRASGKWEGASAEGLPSRANPNARLDFNPQFEITVTKPCDGFISLMQFDKENMFRGKHAIFFMVSKVNGKRIAKVDKTTMVARSGNPINLNIVTAECDFDKSVNYPYKFTIVVANAERGKLGEGEFEFSVYATDPNISVKELPLAKDFPKSGGGGGGNEME